MVTDVVATEDFDTMFAEAAAAAEKGEDLAVVPPPPAAEPPPPEPPAPPPEVPVEPPATPPAAESSTPPEPPVLAPVTTPPEPPAPPAAPPVVAPPAPVVTPPPEPPTETPEAKAAREAYEASIAPYEFSLAEKEAIEKSRRDFPAEWVGIDAHMKRLERELNARVDKTQKNVLQQVYRDLAPVKAGQEAISFEQHTKALHDAHPDYDTVVEQIPAWIAKQPAYRRGAMQAVYDGGSTADVLDLVADYKAAAGLVSSPTPKPTVTPAAAPVKPTDADSLLPVSGRRTTPVAAGGPDKNDFAGAFAEACEALEK